MNINKHLYTDLLHHACTAYADLPALHIKRDGRYRTWTFADFGRDLNRLASVLTRHGLGRGITAAVIGENSPEWVIAFHAVLLTGACTVPIDPNIPPAEIESIIGITGARIVFCSPVYLDLFRSLQARCHSLKQIVILGTSGEGKTEGKAGGFGFAFDFYRYIGEGDPGHDAFGCRFAPDDPMVIIFTSGTTGKAKGVVLCQKNYTAVANHAIPRMGLGAGDTVLSVLPLHHVFGFAAGVGGPLCGGMGVVFVPFIKGPLIIEALQDKAVTMLPAVPKMVSLFYESILHNVKKKGPVVNATFSAMLGLSAFLGEAMGDTVRRALFSSVHKGFGGSLKMIISGGAALGRKYWNGFRFMGFSIVEGYGLTETFGPITVCPAGDPRPGSVGPALAENEIRIAGPNADGIGEVLLRGSCVFAGYYKNDALTKEVFDGEGWFHTGDLGRLDADGFLYLSGRKKDVIVLDTGKNVYPDELEDHYSLSPCIEEIGVFGVLHNDVEIVAAAIVPSKELRKTSTVRQAADLLHEELVRMGRDLPVHRRISDFVVVYHPLPRTTSRKLKKPELLKMYNSIKRENPSAGRLAFEEQLSVMEMALMETGEYRGIIESIARVAPHVNLQVDVRAINPRTHFEIDLGLDSLHLIELLSAIEQTFGITIPEKVFDKMETITDLVSLVEEQKLENRPTSVERVLGLKQRILDMSYFLPEQKTGVKGFGFMRRFAAAVCGNRAVFAEPLSCRNGPYIFVSLHTSVLDAFRILQTLPGDVAEMTLFMSENIRYPRLPYAFYSPNMVMNRKINDPIETIKVSLAVIRSNKNLISFPEGRFSAPGRPVEFKSGVGLVARETGAKIVPVKNHGTELHFGKPFTFADVAARHELAPGAPPGEIAEYIRKKIIEMH
jgi:long-chain acyl-CoA synthetase